MDTSCDELGEADVGVWGQGGGERVVRGGSTQGGPVAEEDVLDSFFRAA